MNLRHQRHLRLKNHTDKLLFNSSDLLNRCWLANRVAKVSNPGDIN